MFSKISIGRIITGESGLRRKNLGEDWEGYFRGNISIRVFFKVFAANFRLGIDPFLPGGGRVKVDEALRFFRVKDFGVLSKKE